MRLFATTGTSLGSAGTTMARAGQRWDWTTG